MLDNIEYWKGILLGRLKLLKKKLKVDLNI